MKYKNRKTWKTCLGGYHFIRKGWDGCKGTRLGVVFTLDLNWTINRFIVERGDDLVAFRIIRDVYQNYHVGPRAGSKVTKQQGTWVQGLSLHRSAFTCSIQKYYKGMRLECTLDTRLDHRRVQRWPGGEMIYLQHSKLRDRDEGCARFNELPSFSNGPTGSEVTKQSRMNENCLSHLIADGVAGTVSLWKIGKGCGYQWCRIKGCLHLIYKLDHEQVQRWLRWSRCR